MLNQITRRAVRAAALSFVVVASCAPLSLAGDLAPPSGAIAPTMKTLQQVEPRTPLTQQTAPGDATSVFKITQPGSYYLTGNVQGVAGKVGVRIDVSNVTLDLNGFALTGVAGALAGVTDHADEGRPVVRNLTVTNGAIVGFPQGGVVLTYTTGSRVSGVSVEGGSYGIYVDENAVIEDCIVRNATQVGIQNHSRATVSRCVVSGSFIGYSLTKATLTDSVAQQCTTGMRITQGLAKDCVVSDSTTGIQLSVQGRAIDCSVLQSQTGILMDGWDAEARGCMIRYATSTGIEATDLRPSIIGNTIASARNLAGTHGYAIRLQSNATGGVVDANTATGCYFGIVVQSTNNTIIRNTLGASVGGNTAVQYQIAAGNRVGAIVKAHTNASQITASGNTGNTISGTTTATTDPFANLVW